MDFLNSGRKSILLTWLGSNYDQGHYHDHCHKSFVGAHQEISFQRSCTVSHFLINSDRAAEYVSKLKLIVFTCTCRRNTASYTEGFQEVAIVTPQLHQPGFSTGRDSQLCAIAGTAAASAIAAATLDEGTAATAADRCAAHFHASGRADAGPRQQR